MAKEKKYDFEAYEKDPITLPRDKAWSNWAKFEKVGDKVQGYIRDVFYRKGEGEFPSQRGITLEQDDGELINVGIKRVPFVLAKINDYRLGDPLTIVYAEQLKPKQKGYKGAKRFEFYGRKMEENFSQKTIAELDQADMSLQNVKDVEEEAELEQLAAETKAALPA